MTKKKNKTTATKSWSYLDEYVTSSTNLRQDEGNFRIQTLFQNLAMFMFFIVNSANIESQTANPFLYQTFNVANNKKLTRCYLKANENIYPKIRYKLSTEPSRVYRDVMSHVYTNNDFQGGTLLNRVNFENLFPFVYFNLPNILRR